jgi:hypothetical protein
LEHSDVVFDQYLQGIDGNICPVGGEISYVDGKVKCSLHPRDIDSGVEEENVPFLLNILGALRANGSF